MPPTLILRDARSRKWLKFEGPLDVISAQRVEQVRSALEKVLQAIERDGLWAAGFISYEAGPAFDPALQVHAPGDFPLLWFGLFRLPEILPTLPVDPGKTFQLGEWTESVSRQAYGQAIVRIKESIARGDTFQVNYTLRMQTSFQGDPLGLFYQLVQSQPTEYGAFLDLDRFAVCSASPELFFQLDQDRILTKPMKGTAARGVTLEQDRQKASDLKGSTKDRAENVMIVDMLRNDLGRIAEAGSVEVPQLFAIQRHPTLWQMTSTVTARSQASVTDILAALFPSASITGAPKVSTTQIIAELETTPRHIYTGSIGFIAPGRQAQFNVAIRTVLVDRLAGLAEYGVGGGIVWDSTAEGEYEECRLKARLLTETHPEFSLLESLLWTPQEGYFLLEYHFRRLSDSAEYFDFHFKKTVLQSELDALAAGLPRIPHKVRLLLERSGKATCDALPLADDPKPALVRLKLAPAPVASGDVFLYHKTTNRQVYQAARQSCSGCDDIILWNEHGQVTETTSANLVLELNGVRITPPVSSGLLAGTYRAWLLDQGQVREQVLLVDDLPRCTRIEIVNSVRPPRRGLLLK